MGGDRREGERSTSSEAPRHEQTSALVWLTWSFLAFSSVTSLDQCSFAWVTFLAGFPLVLGPPTPLGAGSRSELGAFLPRYPFKSSSHLIPSCGPAPWSLVWVPMKCHTQAGEDRATRRHHWDTYCCLGVSLCLGASS